MTTNFRSNCLVFSRSCHRNSKVTLILHLIQDFYTASSVLDLNYSNTAFVARRLSLMVEIADTVSQCESEQV